MSQKPTSLPPFTSTAAPWENSKYATTNSANSTPITTPASDRSAPSFLSASQTSTNYSGIQSIIQFILLRKKVKLY